MFMSTSRCYDDTMMSRAQIDSVVIQFGLVADAFDASIVLLATLPLFVLTLLLAFAIAPILALTLILTL